MSLPWSRLAMRMKFPPKDTFWPHNIFVCHSYDIHVVFAYHKLNQRLWKDVSGSRRIITCLEDWGPAEVDNEAIAANMSINTVRFRAVAREMEVEECRRWVIEELVGDRVSLKVGSSIHL
jgi:hypothetical protein